MRIDHDLVTAWLVELPELIEVERRQPEEGQPLFVPESTCVAAWNVTTTIGDEPHEFVITLSPDFPGDMPRVYLRHPDEYPLLNHVNCHGDICFYDRLAGGFFDTNRPKDVLYSGLHSAFERLEDSLDNRDEDNLIDEFEGSWRWLKGKRKADCFSPPADAPTRMVSKTIKHDLEGDLQAFYCETLPHNRFARQFKEGPERTAWYFPLETSTLPPATQLVTADYIRALFKNIHGDMSEFHKWFEKGMFRKKTGNARHRTSYTQYYNFLFANPRPSGGYALFGVSIQGTNKLSFFDDDGEKAWSITPLEIRHHYREYMTSRAGADNDLADKKVAVVGCGAVGSRVAEKLTKMGVGKLVLVDNEKLTHENIFRHYLGSHYILAPKATALAVELSEEHIGLSAKSRIMTRDIWFEKHDEEVGRMDYIIDATGDFTGMREAGRLCKQGALPPSLFAWVEPCGVGGHAVLVGDTLGCFDCLVMDSDTGPVMSCHYLEPGQTVARDLTGCGSFIPFSALDADKTAIMACDMLLEAVYSPKPPKSLYRSWRGRNDEAEKIGLSFNPIFEATPPMSMRDISDFGSPACPTCGGKR